MTGEDRLARAGGYALDLARFAVRGAADVVELLAGPGAATTPANGAVPGDLASSNGTAMAVEAVEPVEPGRPARAPADRTVLDSAHDAFVAMDEQGTITAWNPAAEATFGWTAAEAIGRTVAETIVPVELREAYREELRRHLEDGEPRALGRRLDLTALHRAGHTFPVEATISAVGGPSGDESFYAFLHDISERKLAERHRAAQLAVAGVLAGASSLEDAMPEVLAAVGGGCGFEAAAYWAVERGSERLSCETFWRASGDAAALEAATRERTLDAGEDPPGAALADRTATWARKIDHDHDFSRSEQAAAAGLRSSLALPLARDGTVFGVVELLTSEQEPPKPEALDALAVIASQIGEFIARVEAERASERIKDEFFALVSHELRTPLTSIIGYADMLAKTEEESLSDRGMQMLEVIRRNAGREMRLVGDLLMLVRIEAGRFELEPGEVEVRPLVEASVEAARPAAEKAGLELSLDAVDVPEFSGDAERLGQVVDNLLGNAIKFTEEGSVAVALSCDEERAAITVTDTGPGIPAEDLGHLFDRLYRAASATAGHVPGTGLGLTIVKGIVEAHGGEVTVESEVGAGTTFRVLLPLAAGEPAEEPAA